MPMNEIVFRTTIDSLRGSYKHLDVLKDLYKSAYDSSSCNILEDDIAWLLYDEYMRITSLQETILNRITCWEELLKNAEK